MRKEILQWQKRGCTCLAKAKVGYCLAPVTKCIRHFFNGQLRPGMGFTSVQCTQALLTKGIRSFTSSSSQTWKVKPQTAAAVTGGKARTLCDSFPLTFHLEKKGPKNLSNKPMNLVKPSGWKTQNTFYSYLDYLEREHRSKSKPTVRRR